MKDFESHIKHSPLSTQVLGMERLRWIFTGSLKRQREQRLMGGSLMDPNILFLDYLTWWSFLRLRWAHSIKMMMERWMLLHQQLLLLQQSQRSLRDQHQSHSPNQGILSTMAHQLRFPPRFSLCQQQNYFCVYNVRTLRVHRTVDTPILCLIREMCIHDSEFFTENSEMGYFLILFACFLRGTAFTFVHCYMLGLNLRFIFATKNFS